MATMAEVAALAGVSTATVSRVLAGKSVRAPYAERVREAAERLAYEPDRTARSLRRRYSDLLALVVPDVENPFFTAVARGVEDTAREAGLSVVLCNSDDDAAQERRYLAIAAAENMAGVILAPATTEPALAALVGKNRAVVVIDRSVPAEVDQVVFDNVAIGRAATERLIEGGAERIACITGPRRTVTARDRATGWRRALRAAGLEAPAGFLRHANYRVDGGRDAMTALLDRGDPPDAVLATNNLVGVGALQVLAPLDVEDDSALPIGVGVIGDLPYATHDPRGVDQTSLRPRELGVRAARMFLERLGGDTSPARRVVLDPAALDPPA